MVFKSAPVLTVGNLSHLIDGGDMGNPSSPLSLKVAASLLRGSYVALVLVGVFSMVASLSTDLMLVFVPQMREES